MLRRHPIVGLAIVPRDSNGAIGQHLKSSKWRPINRDDSPRIPLDELAPVHWNSQSEVDSGNAGFDPKTGTIKSAPRRPRPSLHLRSQGVKNRVIDVAPAHSQNSVRNPLEYWGIRQPRANV